MVTVSFILAVYNEEDVLGDCLDSILSQDYKALEIIVVDDGSTDQTGEVIKTYMKRFPEIRLIENKTNRGPSYTRNRGAFAAKGKILCFIDADSVLSKSWLQETIDSFVGEVSVLSGPNITHPRDTVFAQAIGLGLERGVPDILSAGNSAILRSVFLKLGGFDEGLRYQEDLDLQKRLQRIGLNPFFNPDLIIYHRRKSNVKEYFRQCYIAVHELFPIWIEYGLDQKITKPLVLISITVLLATILSMPPLHIPRISILIFSLLLFFVWTWRQVPDTKAKLLLPLVYSINYIASIAGFFGGLIDYLVLPILLPSSHEKQKHDLFHGKTRGVA